MSTKSIPSALEPYLRLPPETSLILLTSTLGCSINWLTARFIGNTLKTRDDDNGEEESPAVLLVSWMRDLNFWMSEIRRTTGLDVSSKPTQKESAGHPNFTFLDLFSSDSNSRSSSYSSSNPLATAERQITQTLTKLQQQYLRSPQQEQAPPQPQQQPQNKAQAKKVLLILDNPDILLATHPTTITAPELHQTLLALRSHPAVHATISVLAADAPLIQSVPSAASAQGDPGAPLGHRSERILALSPMEAATAAFVTTQAHASWWVGGVRGLETGAARDVSGVLRVTRGGGWYDFGGYGEGEEGRDGEGGGGGVKGEREGDGVREVELLYLVQRDGNVKVFKRGAEETG